MTAPYLRNVSTDPRVTPEVLDAVSKTESGGNPRAVGPVTRYGQAVGEYQFLPSTAKDLGIDPFDPKQSREGAATYLNWLVGQTGNLPDALAAYNTGLGNWRKNRDNLPKETVNYVDKIMGLLAKHEKGTNFNLASKETNPIDPSPKTDTAQVEEKGAGPDSESSKESPPTLPTQLASGPSPSFSKPAPISTPPASQFLGRNNPLAMVESLLKDPLSLSRGETQNMAQGGFVIKKLPSNKRVPNYKYGFKRIPSSVPGPSVDDSGGASMAEGGEVLKAPPQNKVLGALSRVARYADEKALHPFQKLLGRIPLGFSGASSDYTSGNEEGLAAMLAPRLDTLSNVLEEASYGMPLTTGKGMTTGLKPDVGFAALDASQLPSVARMAVSPVKRVLRKARLTPDIAESIFGSPEEWTKSKAAWDEAHGYASGGMVKGALSRIAKMVAADELPNAIQPLQAVKEQGGQWLPGSAKKFVQGPTPWAPEHMKPHDIWAEKAIPKYIERYMGAKGDPLANIEIPHGQGMGRWEELTDPLIKTQAKSQISGKNLPDWAQKLPEDTAFYGVGGNPEGWGSNSVQDYISHVLDHAATIPPEKLKNYDFPRLVQEVQKIDSERAKKMASVEGRMEGTAPYKEYPEGFKWVEVQSPEALKNEGDIMGHCVGGYCEDVKSGRTKIYSLRDPKGESHVTIETSRDYMSPEVKKRAFEISKARGDGDIASSEDIDAAIAEIGLPQSIRQIKGKQNLAPKPEYQQYVQDLIRSGKWGSVKELENSGLRKSSDVFGPTELNALKTRGEEVPQYLSSEDIDRLQKVFSPDPGIPQMRKGGRVPHKMGGKCSCLECGKEKMKRFYK